MQSADSLEPIDTDDKKLESTTKVITLPHNSEYDTKSILSSQEILKSNPECRPSKKSRSRIASAFKRLSNSARKKENPTQKDVLTTNKVVNPRGGGGGEKSTESKILATKIRPKKKNILSKSFLLVGFKKRKDHIDKFDKSKYVEIVKDIQPDSSSNNKKTDEFEDTTADKQIEDNFLNCYTLSANNSEQFDDKLKEQIPSYLSDSTVGTSSVASSSGTNYLRPQKNTHLISTPCSVDISSVAELQTTFTIAKSTLTGTTTKRKKLKSKETVGSNNSSSCSITTASSCSSIAPIEIAQKKSKREADKLVITQSARDTPPFERAPVKPSRIAISTQLTGNTGAIRKTTARTIANLITCTSYVDANGISSPYKLMQNQQSAPSRGHRFPKPTPTTYIATSASTTTTVDSSASQTTAFNEAAPIQAHPTLKQIKYHSLLHGSDSIHVTPTNREKPQSLQSNTSNILKDILLPPPSDTPPLISLDSGTTSPSSRHCSLSSFPAILPIESVISQQSVATTSNNATIGVIPSTKCTQTCNNYYANNKVQKLNFKGHSTDIPDSALSCHLDCPSASDTAYTSNKSNAACPPDISLSNTSYSEHSSFDSILSTDQTSVVICESSRRRIRYVAPPSLNDDYSSLEQKRQTLKHQVGTRKYSLDSDLDTFEKRMPAFGDLTMDQDEEPTIMTSSNTEKHEHLYKILVIGELGTGKTSFIKRYVHQFFSQNYRATIGVDFALKVLNWDANTVIRLQLWDIAGQERFGNMTRVYYKEAVGAFIVFDVTRSGTFDCVSKWKEDLDSKVQLPNGGPIPCILLANKCDQEKQGIATSPEKMDEYVRDNGFAGWYETSAKENINIDEAARSLVNKILLNDKLISSADLADNEKFNVSSSNNPSVEETKNKCSC